jgi:hypothetical protein
MGREDEASLMVDLVRVRRARLMAWDVMRVLKDSAGGLGRQCG